MIVEVVTVMLFAVIKVPPAVRVPTPALNVQPLVAVRISVVFATFLGKSLLAPDAITMLPSVV